MLQLYVSITKAVQTDAYERPKFYIGNELIKLGEEKEQVANESPKQTVTTYDEKKEQKIPQKQDSQERESEQQEQQLELTGKQAEQLEDSVKPRETEDRLKDEKEEEFEKDDSHISESRVEEPKDLNNNKQDNNCSCSANVINGKGKACT